MERNQEEEEEEKRILIKETLNVILCSKYEHYSSECWHNETEKKNKGDETNLTQDMCNSDSDHVLLMSTIGHDEDELHWKLTQDRCENKVHE